MLRKLYLVPVLALLALPAMSYAQFEAGNWTLELSGQGTAGTGGSFDTFDASISSQTGYFFTKELQAGLRNAVTWTDGGSFRGGVVAAFADYHFDMDRWQPYVGANIGYQYGDRTEDSWVAGPEAGIKYFVNATTYIDGIIAYEWNLNEGPDKGGYFYGVGIGFKW
jgi:hypothetical protein